MLWEIFQSLWSAAGEEGQGRIMASERIQLYSLATPNGMKVGSFLPAWLLQ